MRGFFKNTKGAVTVFVTLLLIPSVLVSGTAVDLARVHTARSIMHDANQLAANALLTQYNALLYDIYGLFGIAEDDPILWELLNNYISVSIFGEDSQNRSLGTLQVFYGTDLSMNEILFAPDKNLRNTDVLRRQIEDYMKYRGPVLIVTEFLDALDNNSVKEDSIVIGDKLSIESGIAEMYEMYKRLYDAIKRTDNIRQPIGGISGGSFGAVSSTLRAIRDEFVQLRISYEGWENAEDQAEANEFSTRYRGILSNISARVVGGTTLLNWHGGFRNSEDVWVSGDGFRSRGTTQGLNRTIENAKIQAENFKPNFDTVVSIALEIDALRESLIAAVDELERKLDNGEVSDELREALLERHGNPAMTLIERYREVLQWDNLGEKAASYRDAGFEYIDNEVKPMLDEVKYRNQNNLSAGSLTREELADISSNSRFSLNGGGTAGTVARFAGFSADGVTYSMPPGFKPFAEISDRHNEFFELLSAMMNQPQIDPIKLFDGQDDEGGENAEEQQRNIIDALLEIVDTAYSGITNQPLGAMYINNSAAAVSTELGALGVVDLMSEATNSNMLDIISDPARSLMSAWEYALLLAYCTSVFSNYSTTRPQSIGKTRDDIGGIEFPRSITGVPISPEVNYFFQSEWEYLYVGKDDAGANLSAVTRLLFLVRMVCNYIAVFKVPQVTSVVTSIKAAFAWAPPLAIILGELARAAFVAAESLIDVILLRSGYQVPLIKSAKSGQWICTPSGVVNAIRKISNDEIDGIYDKGLTYSNYMIVLFITRAVFSREAGAQLAERAANLIEWNIVNYQSRAFSDEEKMASALASEGRFRLVDMKTDFSITTTADMRMLFLSMLFAQNFAAERGISAPATMPVTVTDYRGY